MSQSRKIKALALDPRDGNFQRLTLQTAESTRGLELRPKFEALAPAVRACCVLRAACAYVAPSCVLRVTDRGPCIDLQDQALIFEEFRQTADSRGREGTGLGLAMVKKLVELQGGTVRVESRRGEGSTFGVRLPLRPHRLAPARPARAALMDDDPTRLVLKSSLRAGL